MQRVGQLSFDAYKGGPPPWGDRGEVARPLVSSIKVSGALETMDASEGLPQLDQGEEVGVVLTDADGQVIAQARGRVTLAFPEKTIEGMVVTVRQHNIKLS
jgi:hypothetical protein